MEILKEFVTPIFSVIAIIISSYALIKRLPSQNIVDHSQASKNYQEVVISLQEENKIMRDEIAKLRAMFENAHLDIELSVTIGEAPVVKNYKWGTAKLV